MKILIVEDLFLMRRVIKHSLGNIGLTNVIEAADGIDALKQISKNEVDLILVDWLMPNMNGLQLVEALKSEPDYKHIPIIMITTVSEKENVTFALRKGVEEFIAKPFTTEILKRKVSVVASKHNLGFNNN
jgi:two-component system chemotaxis response regulator CheY